MNRTELIIVMSATLFAAFVLGWLLRWAFGRLNKVNSVDIAEIDRLATRLHDTEDALAVAQNQLVQKEAELIAAMDGLGHVRRENEAFREQLEQIKATEEKILHAIEDHKHEKPSNDAKAEEPVAAEPDTDNADAEVKKPSRSRKKPAAKS